MHQRRLAAAGEGAGSAAVALRPAISTLHNSLGEPPGAVDQKEYLDSL